MKTPSSFTFKFRYQLRGPDDRRWGVTQARIVAGKDISEADKKFRSGLPAGHHVKVLTTSHHCIEIIPGNWGGKQCSHWCAEGVDKCGTHSDENKGKRELAGKDRSRQRWAEIDAAQARREEAFKHAELAREALRVLEDIVENRLWQDGLGDSSFEERWARCRELARAMASQLKLAGVEPK